MSRYSVKQLSTLAGVSVRTLHHYDKIGLLKPATRSEKGYRYYGRSELLKLQQILFYKELDFPLKKIIGIINNRSFDILSSLEFHKKQLMIRSNHFKKLIKTLEKTILEIKEKENSKMTDKELYNGFSTEQIKKIKKEIHKKWGEKQLHETEERIHELGKQGWKDTQKKGEEINRSLAILMGLGTTDKKVQKVISMHYKHINIFWDVTKEMYLGLGKMYTEDERFTAYYEKYRPGLALFLYQGITVFCDNEMNAAC